MKGIFAMFPVRVILWTVAMACTGFILTNQGLRTLNSLSVTEAFLGALTGFFLAILFTLERSGDKDLPWLRIPLHKSSRTGAHSTKTETQLRSQSVDPNRQDESGLIVLNQSA